MKVWLLSFFIFAGGCAAHEKKTPKIDLDYGMGDFNHPPVNPSKEIILGE